jgi:hypothetical protein
MAGFIVDRRGRLVMCADTKLPEWILEILDDDDYGFVRGQTYVTRHAKPEYL